VEAGVLDWTCADAAKTCIPRCFFTTSEDRFVPLLIARVVARPDHRTVTEVFSGAAELR
jgi:hypothetical protein